MSAVRADVMRFGSVCSGIEAASAAWLPLGWRCAFMSEIEAFPRAVLKHHHPDTPLHGDFTTIRAGDYEPIDLLVGGTPCQSFSVAGLRRGLADERGNLALEYLRLADRLRPRWMVWENVPGVLSSGNGRDFGSFLGGLGELGYGFAYRVLDAQFFGLAQRRKRVFVVGHFGDWRRAASVLFEPASLRGDSAPRRETGKGVAAPVTAGSPGGSGYRNDPDTSENLIAGTLASNGDAHSGFKDERGLIPLGGNAFDIVPAMTTRTGTGTGRDGMDEYCVAHSLRADGFDASEDGTGRGTPLVPVAFGLELGNQGSGGNVGYSDAGKPFRTLHRGGPPGVAIRDAVRRLTPTECERLQGFPDGHTAIPYRGKPAIDGPRYRALGNSMAVPVMAWIGRRIAREHASIVTASAA